LIVLDLVLDVVILGVHAHLDLGVLEDAAEHRRVAVRRHLLEAVREVPVVLIGADRDSRAHRGVQLGRVALPLLAGVAAKEGLVELAADLGHDDVLAGADVLDGLRPLLEERFDVGVGGESGVVEPVDRRTVDRHRQLLIADLREHAMLVRPPLGEVRQVGHGQFGIRVEGVRAIAVHLHTVLVVVVERVARDVVAPIDHEHTLPGLGSQALGHDRAGVAGPDDEGVVAVGHRSRRH